MPVKKKSKANRGGDARAFANEINQELGLENPIRLGSDDYFKIERIPTGSFILDRITGGGFALGRHYECFGSESSGKSHVVYRTMALSQQRGNLCAIVDPEHSFDNERFAFLGGNPDELLASHPENAEDAIATMMVLAKHAKNQLLEIVAIDSVSSLVPTEEMSKDPRDKDQPASQARMMSRALRRITAVNKKTLFLWTNQQRVDIGVKFGNPNVTSGGRALRYYATGRIEFQRGARIKQKRKIVRDGKPIESEVTTGRWIQVNVEKDKSQRPGRMGSFVFDYDLKTIDQGWELISLGLEDEMITRNTSGQYVYEDIDGKVWSGSEKKFRGYLRDNPVLFEEIAVAINDATRQLGQG
jgi:recombination protein RecA